MGKLLKPCNPSPEDFNDWQSRMRAAFHSVLGEQDMRQLVESLLEKAKGGDLQAAKLLLTYAIGSPVVKANNAIIVQRDEPAPLPSRPTSSLPGSEHKVDILADRVANGRAVFNPKDKLRDLG